MKLQARPKRRHDLRIVLDAVLLLFAIFVLVVITSTGYPR